MRRSAGRSSARWPGLRSQKANGRRKWWLVGLLLTVVPAGAFLASRTLVEKTESALPTYPVQQGEFVISLKLKGGELEAIEAENVVAPRVRGQLKIVELFPEGEQVAVGDLTRLGGGSMGITSSTHMLRQPWLPSEPGPAAAPSSSWRKHFVWAGMPRTMSRRRES